MEAQEREWLARYRQGDVKALALLVEQYRRPLLSFIYNLTEGRGDPEGVFQDTWLRAIRKLADFREDNLLGWLFRIARNLVFDQYRRDRFRGEMRSGPAGEESWEERVADRELTPDQITEGRNLGEKIAAAIRTLPLEQREVFLMRTQGDMSFKEIAKVQGVSLNTALGRMHYAVGKLRKQLRDEYEIWTGERR